MKNDYFVLCFLMLMSCLVSAQEKAVISGIVRDAENSEFVTSVFVQLSDSMNGRAYNVNTNIYGFYTFSVPEGKYELKLNHMSYSVFTDSVVAKGTIRKDITLEKNSRVLDEIVVRGATKRLKNAEMSTHEMVIAEVKKLPVVLGEPDILKALQFLPGITNVGDASVGFNVRGGNVDQNLILLDEAPIFNPSHVFGLFSVFNPESISSFKLYKGGIPSRYGGRLSSVLDVRQFEGSKKGYSLDAGIGLLAANLSIQGPIYKKKGQTEANNSFFVSGRRSYFDLFLSLSPDTNAQNSTLYFYDLNLKTNWLPNKNNQIFLSAYLGNDFFGFSNLFKYGWGNITSTLRWNHIYNSRLFSNISLVYSNYAYNIKVDLPEQAFDWNGVINNLFLKGSWEYSYNSKNDFIAGFTTSYIHIDPGRINSSVATLKSFSTPSEQGLESAIYAEWIKKIGNRLTLHGGLRLEWFARIGPYDIQLYEENQPVIYLPEVKKYVAGNVIGKQNLGEGIYYDFLGVSPRLNVSYVIHPLLSVKASYNTMYQYMQIITSSSTTVPTDLYRLSGKYIPPLRSYQFSLGLFGNIPVMKKSIEVSVEGFYKILEDGIDHIDGASLLFNKNIETELMPSSGTAYGVELFAEKKWGKLTGWISYTYSSSLMHPHDPNLGGKGINNGKIYSANYDLPHSLSIVLNYAITKRIQASAAFTYRTGRPTSVAVGSYVYGGANIPFYSDRNAFRFDDYHRLDLSITFEGKQRKHFKDNFVVSIYNVYNRLNPWSYSFTIDRNGTNNKVEEFAIYGIIPSVKYSFNIK